MINTILIIIRDVLTASTISNYHIRYKNVNDKLTGMVKRNGRGVSFFLTNRYGNLEEVGCKVDSVT